MDSVLAGFITVSRHSSTSKAFDRHRSQLSSIAGEPSAFSTFSRSAPLRDVSPIAASSNFVLPVNMSTVRSAAAGLRLLGNLFAMAEPYEIMPVLRLHCVYRHAIELLSPGVIYGHLLVLFHPGRNPNDVAGGLAND